MLLTIRYTDQRRQHEVDCDEIQSNCIVKIVKTYMIVPSDFDFMHIDLRDENVEQVSLYNFRDCRVTPSGIEGRPVCAFGGALAWEIYRQTAEVWPTINYYLPCFAGRAEHTS